MFAKESKVVLADKDYIDYITLLGCDKIYSDLKLEASQIYFLDEEKIKAVLMPQNAFAEIEKGRINIRYSDGFVRNLLFE
ncbi:hypothetical protein HZB88_01055 [archaeon]|nr:hypothetical protein [archaeon]